MKEPAETALRPGGRKGKKPAIALVPAEDDRAGRRQLEKSVSWTGREWLRCLWYRFRLAVQEMNYATRRMAELQMRLP